MEEQSLFSRLPREVLMMITDDPNVIEQLCQSNQELYRRYCMNPNGDFWRDLYKRKYGVDLENIPPNSSIKKIYQILYDLEGKSMENKILTVAELGMINLLEKYISELNPLDNNLRILNQVVDIAARAGYKEIVEWMFRLGVSNYDWIMKLAASGGHEEIVQLMLDKGADEYGNAMMLAAKGGHKDIMQLMIDKGAKNYSHAMGYAATGGYMEVVLWMINLGASDYKWALEQAAGGGHKEIVQLILDKGNNSLLANDYSNAIIFAQMKGHEDIAVLIKTHRYKKHRF